MITEEGSRSKLRTRNEDLDIIKGMLVVTMVLYHCASMAHITYPELGIIPNGLKFLHYAFLLITGFLCGWYYLPKLCISPQAVRARLRFRAGRITAIFLLMNVFLYCIGSTLSYEKLRNSVNSFSNIMQNFILSVSGKLVAFQILFPIAIFLLVASLLLGRVSIPVLLGLILFASIAGCFSQTIMFVEFGMVGMLFGILARAGILTIFWQWIRYHKWLPPTLLLVYLLNLARVRWLVTVLLPLKLVVYTAESFFWFATFLIVVEFFVGLKIRDMVIQLGRYTLFAYLAQMLIIRLGYMVIQKMEISGLSYYFVNLTTSLIILFFVIALLDGLRHRYSAIDDLYRIVFQ